MGTAETSATGVAKEVTVGMSLPAATFGSLKVSGTEKNGHAK